MNTLIKIDLKIINFLQTLLNPQLLYTDGLLQLPVIYANALRWNNIKRLNYIANKDGKVLHPLITIHRVGLLKLLLYNRQFIPNLHNNTTNSYVFKKRDTKKTLLDKINNTQNTKDKFISVVVPTRLRLNYLLHCWVDFFLHMNIIKLLFMQYDKTYWCNLFYTTILPFNTLHLTSALSLRVLHMQTNFTVIANVYPSDLIVQFLKTVLNINNVVKVLFLLRIVD